MSDFALAFGLIFLAELGDKTQLVVLVMAARFRALVVLAAVLTATLLINGFSVVVGGAASRLLPPALVKVLAGLAFLAFGLWTLKGGEEEDEAGPRPRRFRSPFLIIGLTFFLAEFGDKTMLSTAALAATQTLLPVWLGATSAMVLASALAILVGHFLGKKLPERPLQLGAAFIFLLFGLGFLAAGGAEFFGLKF